MGKQKEMIGGCCVCSDERGWDENPLVYCDGHGCNVAVHQACYGITTVPSGPWFCRKCESQERAARVRCELCPLKEGALKRTDSGGWCHVVCALFIPEAWFGNVQTMEPIILKGVPTDRFHKVCYICEEHKRESKAQTGACMQCNKTGCKQHFHVTCAQALGLLCEEAGNYDNVKYCGYCSYHFKKLKDASVKLIPPFKPPPSAETPETTPDKKFPSLSAKDKRVSSGPELATTSELQTTTWFKMRGKGPPDSSSSLGSPDSKMADLSPTTGSVSGNQSASNSKFTTANFVETTITPSPANLFSPSSVTSPTATTPTTSGPESSAAAGLLAIASQGVPPPQGESGGEKKDRKSSNSHSFADLANAPLFAVAATPTSHESKDGEGKKDAASKDATPGADSTSAENAVASNKRPLEKSDKKPKAKKPKTEKTGGAGGRKSGGNAAASNNIPTVVKELPSNDPYKMVPTPPPVSQEEKPKKPGGGRKRKSSTSVTGSAPISPAHTTPLTNTSIKSGSKNNTPSDTPTSSGMHSPVGKTPEQVKVSPTANSVEGLVNGGSNLPLHLPKHGKNKPPSTTSSQDSLNSVPVRMEQLLEQQWEQSTAFIMEQGQHFDIASLLNCLYRLKQENQRLEEHIEQLTVRRDHLLAVNARLALPLAESSQQGGAGEGRRTPQSGGRGGGAAGTHRPTNHFVAPEAAPHVNGPQHAGDNARTVRSPARASPLTNHVSTSSTTSPHLSTPPSSLTSTPRVPGSNERLSNSLSSVVQAGLGVGITPPSSSSASSMVPPSMASHTLEQQQQHQRQFLLQQQLLMSQQDPSLYQAYQHQVMSSLAGNPALHPGMSLGSHRPSSRGGLGGMSHSPSRKTPTSGGDKTKEKS